jgi:cell division protein FtsA
MSLLQFGVAPKMKPISRKRAALVAALDVGTSKVVCMIARLEPSGGNDVLRRRSHSIEVIGFGHTEARGMKAGSVADLEAADHAIRHAVEIAEQSAGVHLESVAVSISAGRFSSERFTASVDVAGPSIRDGDIMRLLQAGSQHSGRDGRVVLHSLPLGYAIDGVHGIRDPRGMLARRFGLDMHVVSADVAAPRNLMLAIERGQLSIEAMVASPYMAGLSALADDESDLGAAVVDMGAGTTTIALFSGGRFVHADGFAVGGMHVTMDLARGLNARVADAERIKTFYGTVVSGMSDERDMIPVPAVGSELREPPQVVSRAALVPFIRPRVEEILEMIRDRLSTSPFAAEPQGTVVLTGGASQLAGLPDIASRILGRQVRIGRPLGLSGLPDAARGPAFAVAAGLLVYPQAAHLEHFEPRKTRQAMTGGYLTKVHQWLRESF